MTDTHIVSIGPEGNRDPRLTMSSREIAELTGKEHKNVLADIRRMLESLNLMPADFSAHIEVPMPRGGFRKEEVFNLPKRETLVLVSGYSVELRARIIDRWMELEEGLRKPQLVIDPSDPKVMLAVFDHLQKTVAEKDAIIAVQGEQVKKLERLEGASGSMCLTDAAKTLGIRRDELTKLMSARRWIYKRVGNKNWIGFQDRIQTGVLEHDEHLYMDNEGRERVSTRALVTAKGLVKLAELLNQPLH